MFSHEFSHDMQFKIMIIGNDSIGKKSLLSHSSENPIKESGDFIVKTKEILIKTKKITLQIWSWQPASKSNARFDCSHYYRACRGVVIAFDLTNEQSFRDVKNWHGEIRRYAYAKENTCTILVGTKADLDKQRIISKQEALNTAKELEMAYFETSIKDNRHINEAFTFLANLIDTQYQQELIDRARQLAEKNPPRRFHLPKISFHPHFTSLSTKNRDRSKSEPTHFNPKIISSPPSSPKAPQPLKAAENVISTINSFALDVLDKYFLTERNYIAKELEELKEVFKTKINKKIMALNENVIDYFDTMLKRDYQRWCKDYATKNYQDLYQKLEMLKFAVPLLTHLTKEYDVPFGMLVSLKNLGQEKMKQSHDPLSAANIRFMHEWLPAIEKIAENLQPLDLSKDTVQIDLQLKKQSFTLRHQAMLKLLNLLIPHFNHYQLTLLKNNFVILANEFEKLQQPNILIKQLEVTQLTLMHTFIEECAKKFTLENELFPFNEQMLPLMKYYEQTIRLWGQEKAESLSMAENMLMDIYKRFIHKLPTANEQLTVTCRK